MVEGVQSRPAMAPRADVASSAQGLWLNRARQGREAEARLVTASATEYGLKINARTDKVVSRKVDD